MELLPELVAPVDTGLLRPGGPCPHRCGSHTHLAPGCHLAGWTRPLHEVTHLILASSTAGWRAVTHFTDGESSREEKWPAKVTHPVSGSARSKPSLPAPFRRQGLLGVLESPSGQHGQRCFRGSIGPPQESVGSMDLLSQININKWPNECISRQLVPPCPFSLSPSPTESSASRRLFQDHVFSHLPVLPLPSWRNFDTSLFLSLLTCKMRTITALTG